MSHKINNKLADGYIQHDNEKRANEIGAEDARAYRECKPRSLYGKNETTLIKAYIEGYARIDLEGALYESAIYNVNL